MIWVNRAGINSKHIDVFLQNSKIYLPWDGYKIDLSEYGSISELKDLVCKEKGECNRTSISNWAGQLYAFSKGMSVDDYVLIPHEYSRMYTFAQIVGDYSFSPKDANGLYHSREIKILINNIPKEEFPKAMQYSLGAFRTIFKVKNEDDCLDILRKYM